MNLIRCLLPLIISIHLCAAEDSGALLYSYSKIGLTSADILNKREKEVVKISDFLSQTWKKVDIIIHNAGALLLKPFSETTQTDFESIYKVNVFGVANLTRICLPYLKKGSHVVFLLTCQRHLIVLYMIFFI